MARRTRRRSRAKKARTRRRRIHRGGAGDGFNSDATVVVATPSGENTIDDVGTLMPKRKFDERYTA